MRSTAQVIGLFGVLQLGVIWGAWLLTRAFRKIYVASGFPASMMPDAGWGLVFADWGWVCLLLPLVWCMVMASLSQKDAASHGNTGRIARMGLVSLVLVVAVFGGTGLKMMNAAISGPKVPLKDLMKP